MIKPPSYERKLILKEYLAKRERGEDVYLSPDNFLIEEWKFIIGYDPRVKYPQVIRVRGEYGILPDMKLDWLYRGYHFLSEGSFQDTVVLELRYWLRELPRNRGTAMQKCREIKRFCAKYGLQYDHYKWWAKRHPRGY